MDGQKSKDFSVLPDDLALDDLASDGLAPDEPAE